MSVLSFRVLATFGLHWRVDVIYKHVHQEKWMVLGRGGGDPLKLTLQVALKNSPIDVAKKISSKSVIACAKAYLQALAASWAMGLIPNNAHHHIFTLIVIPFCW